MVNKQFESYKIGREIKRSGSNYTFTRIPENELHEPTGEPVTVGSIRGLYHENNSSVIMGNAGASSYRTRKVPMILCSYADWNGAGICVGDETVINGKRRKVTGAVNVQEWNVCVDVTLEAVDEGTVQI